MKVILASGSPRRRELLANVFDEFEVIASGADEALREGTDVYDAAEELARQKCAAVAKEHPDALTIGADTVVILGGKIFGKPRDARDAQEMLRRLSGKTHSVVTGCSLMIGGRTRSFSQTTAVTFYELSDEEIDRYIATAEPMDKAGAYGIQGRGALLVKEIRGDYFNVVGLPVARLSREVNDFIRKQS